MNRQCSKCGMILTGNIACNCRSKYERIKQQNQEKAVGKAGPTFHKTGYWGNSKRGSGG